MNTEPHQPPYRYTQIPTPNIPCMISSWSSDKPYVSVPLTFSLCRKKVWGAALCSSVEWRLGSVFICGFPVKR